MTEETLDTQTDNYRVNLEIFSGPLDLLLHLIKVEEVDIYDIPIARITSQYLRYIELMKTLDLEVAGEFILMAATLIRIKTRLLLPQDETDEDEPDPREELIMALVEYKKYKEAGDILGERARIEEHYVIPPSPVEQITGAVDLQPMTSLYDLIVAFRDVLATKPAREVHEVNAQRVTIEERMLRVVQLLRQRESATFLDLFSDAPHKIVAVVTFVAVLELARTHRIRIHQALPFSEVRVYPGEHINAPLREIDLVDYANNESQSVTV
ncbi:MAG: segregation/condensation protein A [Candidatus Zixiibacteriota bacterium]